MPLTAEADEGSIGRPQSRLAAIDPPDAPVLMKRVNVVAWRRRAGHVPGLGADGRAAIVTELGRLGPRLDHEHIIRQSQPILRQMIGIDDATDT